MSDELYDLIRLSPEEVYSEEPELTELEKAELFLAQLENSDAPAHVIQVAKDLVAFHKGSN